MAYTTKSWSYLERLPAELLLKIFLCLPIKDLKSVSLVSYRLYDNISTEGGYHSLLGIRICFEKILIFTKDKDILSIILRIKDKSLHLEDLGINKKNMDEITSVLLKYM